MKSRRGAGDQYTPPPTVVRVPKSDSSSTRALPLRGQVSHGGGAASAPRNGQVETDRGVALVRPSELERARAGPAVFAVEFEPARADAKRCSRVPGGKPEQGGADHHIDVSPQQGRGRSVTDAGLRRPWR